MTRRIPEERPSRYQRVQQILDNAQGKTIPSYDGYRDFWNLPYDEFLTVVIAGQHMIAEPLHGDQPASGASTSAVDEGCCSCCGATDGTHHPDCWPTTGKGGAKPPSGEKRSARSGLIIGLLGDYPFDGSIFPKLMWHANHDVSSSDIQFIADWIDDGCPIDDSEDAKKIVDGPDVHQRVTIQVREQDHVALTNGEQAHTPCDEPTSTITDSVQGLRQRKSVSSMKPAELSMLRQAIWCMHQYNDYFLDERSWDYWGRIHANSCQHGWEQFLPWHRLYLYFFEQQLRDYDNSITLPYWDYTNYSSVNRNTENTTALDKGVIPAAYRCWIDQKGIDTLKDRKGVDGKALLSAKEISSLEQITYDPTTANSQQNTFNSGLRFLAAAGISYELDPFTNDINQRDYRYTTKIKAIYDVLWETNPLWYRCRWPGSMGHAAHYPTSPDIDAILATKGFNAFGGGPSDDHHYGRLEEVHNGIHNFAGGMNPEWEKYSDGNDQSVDNPKYGDMVDNRVTAYDPIFWAHHCNIDRLWYLWQQQNPNVNPEDLNGVLAPWSLSVADSLSTTKLGYEYLKDSHHVPTIPQLPYQRLKSTPLGVRSHVLSSFDTAQVRLHRVQKAKRNGIIRVFLNLPDADVNTPIDNNIHYAGQVTTFGGTCVGGPNHCDVPFPRRQRFDHRPLHHNEPRNFRLDVTNAVKRLRDENQVTDISVHLVVMDVDGAPTAEALYFDGVSLNFMD